MKNFIGLPVSLEEYSISDLNNMNSYIHHLHNYVSAWTCYKNNKESGNAEMAESYLHYAERLKQFLPDEWKNV